MMWNRTIVLPLVVLIIAGVVDGAALGGTHFAGWSVSAWPVVAGLAALVITSLAAHSHASTAEVEHEPDAWFAVVDGQTKLIASSLVIAGLAVFLAGVAPHGGKIFAMWAGFACVAMGFLLAVFKAAFRRTPGHWATPGSDPLSRDESDAAYWAN